MLLSDTVHYCPCYTEGHHRSQSGEHQAGDVTNTFYSLSLTTCQAGICGNKVERSTINASSFTKSLWLCHRRESFRVNETERFHFIDKQKASLISLQNKYQTVTWHAPSSRWECFDKIFKTLFTSFISLFNSFLNVILAHICCCPRIPHGAACWEEIANLNLPALKMRDSGLSWGRVICEDMSLILCYCTQLCVATVTAITMPSNQMEIKLWSD